MEYVFLGSTGVKVSRLTLGTMNFGDKTSQAASKSIFNLARDAGVNFIDCANVYASQKTETILGRLLRGCRDEFVLASKVGSPLGDGPLDKGLSRHHIMLQVEKSLARLGTDRIDLYYLHRFDPHTPMEETLRALDDLVRQGKVLYVAASNWAAWQTALALGVSAGLGLAGFCAMQPMYNLIKRQAEVELLPLAQDQGLAVMPYNPLAGGLLTGIYQKPGGSAKRRLKASKLYAKRYAAPLYHETAARFVEFARKNGYEPAALALAWVLGHPAITSAITGPRTLGHMKGYLSALEIEMTPELREAISALGPPPPLATDRDEERD